MKILWFTNTPCSLSRKYNPNIVSGGWMEALENKLNTSQEVELYISFYDAKKSDPVKYGNSEYYPVLRERNYLLEIIKRLFSYKNDDKVELPRLQEVVEKIKPDIIHIHGTEENFGLLQKYVSQPVVVSIQGIVNPLNEKFFSGIPSEIAKKNETLISRLLLRTQSKSFVQFKSIAKRELEILYASKNVIGRTNWDRRVSSILAENRNYYHIDELLRSEFYSKKWNSDNFSSKEIRIITVSSNNIYKGFETIVKAAQILSNLKDVKFSWQIIGLSENDSIVKMTLSWLKIKVEDVNIKLLGKMNPDKFIPLMQESNIFCQTSHIENSSNSLCEAMYLGMPIVASFAGGTDSMLENNKEGILVQNGDQFAIAGAIVELKMNAEKTIEMAENARKRAIKRHDPEKITNELIDLYKAIIGK
jgi:glycosyltransferase involved in cell wall biosynthesis